MTDLVERLRDKAQRWVDIGFEPDTHDKTLREAADEIERLERELRTARNKNRELRRKRSETHEQLTKMRDKVTAHMNTTQILEKDREWLREALQSIVDYEPILNGKAAVKIAKRALKDKPESQ